MTSNQPLYAQVEAALAARLGVDLHPGDRLPTEDELIAEYGVSRITVRRALQNLVARELVVTRRGVGSFVATPRFTQPLTALTGFVEDMDAQGVNSRARVLSVEEIGAPAAVSEALRLPPGEAVVAIERVRVAAGHPVSYDRTYLPQDVGRLVAQDDLENEPIFALLENRHDTPLVEASYALTAETADATVAEALQIPTGSAIFRIERTSFTTGRIPVDYEILHYRGDAITFTTRLPRHDVSDGDR
ncbi:GntR family transcriptional regulator [Gordonia neofelifaecis]|uniref:GntR family transcriptional regulator n=1 Tax=Gordonia neofelifaecis NRRL B-59395 TaxID=644548 RepID=F1YNS7_9ACTN|nr:GntR family transcriptional regulator [Gordonia neofelifaecis]EGD53684.1 GntR family transcriptional regulator [Gordonia neofelifaecis NRRL B-59395]